MSQMHFYVPDAVAARLRERARARGMSVSQYLAGIIHREMKDDWPEAYFEEVAGGWQGRSLRRAPQGRHDAREAF